MQEIKYTSSNIRLDRIDSVTDQSNAYTDISSETYATFKSTGSGTSRVYLKGFNIQPIPEAAKNVNIRAAMRTGLPIGFSSLSGTFGLEVLKSDSVSADAIAYTNTTTMTRYRVFDVDLTDVTTVDELCSLPSLSLAFRFTYHSSSNISFLIYGAEIVVSYTLPVNKVTVNKNGTPETLIDLTEDTVTPETLLSGYTAHDRSGAIITGIYEASIPSNYGLITWDGSVLTVS